MKLQQPINQSCNHDGCYNGLIMLSLCACCCQYMYIAVTTDSHWCHHIFILPSPFICYYFCHHALLLLSLYIYTAIAVNYCCHHWLLMQTAKIASVIAINHHYALGSVFLRNEVRQELKFQMALQHKSGLFSIEWQYRFRILADKFSFQVFFFYSCFIYFWWLINCAENG